MKKNFNNQNFEWLFQDITSSMPKIIFTGIILTYLITAALNVYFLPLPLLLSIPASLMLQFGRFAIVFIDFLNPSDKRSKYPPRVAAVATVIALLELWFSIQGKSTGAEFWAMFFFIGAIICFGYVLEIQFIDKGIEAYGIGVKEPRKRNPPKPKESAFKMNATTSQPIKFTMAICFMFAVYVLPAQKNHFMAYNYMSIEKIGGDKLERTFYDTNEEQHYIDTITTDFLTSWNFWDGYSRSHLDNDLFMTYGTQTMKYIKNKELWYYKGKYYNYIDLLKFLVKYSKKNFVNKKIQW
jgi:hypothetical protein